MTRHNSIRRVSRRSALGIIGAVGIGTGVGTAQPDHDRGRGNDTRQEGAGREEGQPDHHDFECPDGMDHLGTFELVTIEDDDGELLDCYFQQDDGEFHITITGYESKDGEDCEPVTVFYESESHDIGQVASFGGQDTHVDDDPEDGVYDSELETPGGQQAAISLLDFCGTEQGTADEDADDESDNGETDDGSD